VAESNQRNPVPSVQVNHGDDRTSSYPRPARKPDLQSIYLLSDGSQFVRGNHRSVSRTSSGCFCQKMNVCCWPQSSIAGVVAQLMSNTYSILARMSRISAQANFCLVCVSFSLGRQLTAILLTQCIDASPLGKGGRRKDCSLHSPCPGTAPAGNPLG